MKRSPLKYFTLLLVLTLFLGMMPANIFAGGWYSQFRLGYKTQNGNDAILESPTGVTITPPSFSRFPIPKDGEKGDNYVIVDGEKWEFLGWLWDNEMVDFAYTNYMSNQTYIFYAYWKKPGDETVTITFESGFDDVEAPAPIIVKKNKDGQYVIPQTPPLNYQPKKEGFTEAGEWIKKDELEALQSGFNYYDHWEKVQTAKGIDKYRIRGTVVESDTTFVLKWLKTWNVRFMDGETVVESQDIVNGKTTNKLAKTPVKDGYVLSWYYVDGENRIEFKIGETAVEKDLTVYADWKRMDHVTYYNVDPFGWVTGETKQVDYSETENSDEFNARQFKLATFESTGFQDFKGFDFLGWRIVEKEPSNPSFPIDPGEGTVVKKSPARGETSSNDQKEIMTESKDDGSDAPIAPGTSYDLAAHVYVVPVWGTKNLVTYLTNYYDAYPDGRMDAEEDRAFYEFDGDVKEFKVLTFEEAFKGEKDEPLGFRFAGWMMAYTDDLEDDLVVPIIPGTIEPGLVDDEKKRSGGDGEATNEPAEEGGFVEVEGLIDPNTTQDMHLRVYLAAKWEPCFKVIYHRVEPGSTLASDAEYKKEYSIKEVKDAGGKFTVLEYSDTGLETVPGYEFDFWTKEVIDIEPNNGDVRPPVNPPLVEREEDAWQEQLRDDVVFRVVKASDKTAELISAEEAKPNSFLDEKEKEDDIAVVVKPTDGLSDKDDPNEDKDKPIHPGDTEEFYPEVHFYAHWKAIVYNVKWVDEDETVLHGPEKFTVEDDKPKDTDYNTVYKKDNPTKKEDEKNTYEFSGWKEEADKDGNITFTAQYTPTPKVTETEKHSATWVDEDGKTELNKESFDDGKEPPKADSFTAPEKEGKEFDHWDEENVKDENGKETGDVIYTAVYKPIPVPKTADTGNMGLWMMISLLSLAGIALITRKRRED
ncbi:MAG: hypothetical protein IKD87_06595 [Oscillospiraceae bacterium]|nr:hypothetical protein [Oscillospiraceae bacterium]